MPIKQTSKVQARSGLQQNLPQLAKGELGWAVDTQRLYIGNGNVSEGAPFQGNTEIVTVVSAASSPINIPVSGQFQQSPDGIRTVFWTTGNIAPEPNTMIVWDNFPLVPGVGFTVSGFQVTFTVAPAATDNLFWQGWIS
jgi:hypothetical protein